MADQEWRDDAREWAPEPGPDGWTHGDAFDDRRGARDGAGERVQGTQVVTLRTPEVFTPDEAQALAEAAIDDALRIGAGAGVLGDLAAWKAAAHETHTAALAWATQVAFSYALLREVLRRRTGLVLRADGEVAVTREVYEHVVAAALLRGAGIDASGRRMAA